MTGNIEDIIRHLTDDECKKWMRFRENKTLLRKYWEEKYPTL